MDPEQVLRFSEPEIGLEAVLVLDSTVLGPAAGGIRTARYASIAEATVDARKLARAMTLKCSIAGLDAGGGKAVILQQPNWDRPAVFRRFGEIVQELAGQFRTAGDLGTSEKDLRIMATTCEYVHTQERTLGDAVAQGLVACMRSLARVQDRELGDLQIAVQGCGAIGSAVTRRLAQIGTKLWVSDLRDSAVASLVQECGALRLEPRKFLESEVDVLCPCAVGDVLSAQTLHKLKAWGVCGGANNIVSDHATAEALASRQIAVVPDILSSAGAVIAGIGETVMGLSSDSRSALIEALGETTMCVLTTAASSRNTTHKVALSMAEARLSRSV